MYVIWKPILVLQVNDRVQKCPCKGLQSRCTMWYVKVVCWVWGGLLPTSGSITLGNATEHRLLIIGNNQSMKAELGRWRLWCHQSFDHQSNRKWGHVCRLVMSLPVQPSLTLYCQLREKSILVKNSKLCLKRSYAGQDTMYPVLLTRDRNRAINQSKKKTLFLSCANSKLVPHQSMEGWRLRSSSL